MAVVFLFLKGHANVLEPLSECDSRFPNFCFNTGSTFWGRDFCPRPHVACNGNSRGITLFLFPVRFAQFPESTLESGFTHVR